MEKYPLPEVDKLKKRQKRLKVTWFIGLVLIIFASLGISLLWNRAGSAVNKDILSVTDVKHTVVQSGLSLTSNSMVNPADYKMGQVEPQIYEIKNFDGMLFIYKFTSIGERDTIFDQWQDTNGRKSNSANLNMFSPKWQYNRAYAAKNTIIVVCLSQFPGEEYARKISPRLRDLGKEIFYNLNEGQQIVYQGEGDNWRGKVIINYYNHFWTDDKGVLRFDGWNHRQPVIEFKGDPSNIQGNFSYEFKSAIDEFGGTDAKGFDASRFAENDSAANYGGVILGFGGIGGSGAMPPKDNVYTLTVKWNNKQETFDLKASK
ncbi:hypothetical protein ACPUYX_05985 [Desulfosporosinus sp. SYSU MS00001]|uniref:hypothetical protein n=1 Tax=Desulfosporosinus sp. SYSU MS00001 TaxID=3416284 RepID=UPI003CE88F4B